MRYWNKDNFAGLLELARELEKAPALRGLAEYCVLREKGLRKEALSRLDDFLRGAALWDGDLARRSVLTIVHLDARTPAVHQFMTHPLLVRLIYPTLEQWMADEPSAQEPLRWWGLLRSDADALRRALSLEPGDIPVRRRLISFALGDADYATHHLDESVLLNTVEEIRTSIATARKWIVSAPETEAFADMSAEADVYEQMIDDWVAYNKAPVGTFSQWCEARGRNYGWPTSVYYDDNSAQPASDDNPNAPGEPRHR